MDVARPLVVNAIPTYGTVSTDWVDARRSLSTPLGASVVDIWETDQSNNIAEMRNILVKKALQLDARYIFFIGDDTLPPPHAFMQMYTRMKNNPDIKVTTGLYTSRSYPPQPFIWRDWMAGPYYDWHVGEFFKVDWAGCDCLLIDMEVFKTLPEPWFSIDYVFGPEQDRPHLLSTEDIYFYEKLRAHHIQPWCDAGVQCVHQDRNTKAAFYLPQDWPQAQPASGPIPTSDPTYLIADIGAGRTSPFSRGRVVRFDIDESVSPDVRCDVHSIPEPDCKYDEVWSRHVLEHFPADESEVLLREWCRILKIGGVLKINVPNLECAARRILDGPEVTPVHLLQYAYWQVYGQQKDRYDFHKTGFTPRSLGKLVEYGWGGLPIHTIDAEGNLAASLGCFDPADTHVTVEGPGGENLQLTAVKRRHPKAAVIGPDGVNWATYIEDGGTPVVQNFVEPITNGLEPAGV